MKKWPYLLVKRTLWSSLLLPSKFLRLVLIYFFHFQNRFDGMWRKLQTYQSGEELFGLPQTDYPDLAQIRKELNLLQKLYKLYNDVIDRVTSYYDIPWGEVNIEEINNELMEFQNRCRKLPKGLKEWPAFFALKKTIDDFNDMCPLLELMANKAMKPRHWQRIMDSLNHIFEFESEGFCLKNILEAPLLQHKEDIEVSAVKLCLFTIFCGLGHLYFCNERERHRS